MPETYPYSSPRILSFACLVPHWPSPRYSWGLVGSIPQQHFQVHVNEISVYPFERNITTIFPANLCCVCSLALAGLACDPTLFPQGVTLFGDCSPRGVCKASCPMGLFASVVCSPEPRILKHCGAVNNGFSIGPQVVVKILTVSTSGWSAPLTVAWSAGLLPPKHFYRLYRFPLDGESTMALGTHVDTTTTMALRLRPRGSS